MKLNKIGINHHDNDLWRHFFIVLTNIKNILEYMEDRELPDSREELGQMINAETRSVSIILINAMSRGMKNLGVPVEHKVNHSREPYELINYNKVLINDEVDRFLISKKQFWNGEFFYIDLKTGECYFK